MRLPRILGALGLALATALVVPALPVTPAPTASAAGCTGAGGVTVVVDYNQLGGDILQGCVADGGGKVARGVFSSAGVSQSDVARTPGFVCRVNGKPTQSQDPCVNTPPATAYWSLWWTDGNGGPWVYSSLGVNSLKVPDGGYLAWSWQGQSAKSPPDVAPVAREDEAPAGGDGNGGGSNGSGGGSSNGGSGGGGSSSDMPSTSPEDTPSASEDPTEDPTADGGAGARSGKDGKGGAQGRNKADKAGKGARKDKDKRKGATKDRKRDGTADEEGAGESVDSPLTDADGDTEQVSSATEEDPAGLPVWVPLAVLLVLAAGGVGAVVWRRRTGGTP
ncbi:hypothetical protein [uncultured Nocardioides sp.]|uniref:hypothetical protein n=1 Tax=uncultured Nocardioides sp. TaxID=198441 RepID=UPI0026316C81|nr:hypothetical protein [uncultured Nocardioides sp.]